jgi:glycosyltransferase involved in cell wall biosynthesis
MRVLWICGLPGAVEEKALHGENHGSRADWSWIVAHLPPPSNIDLQVACLWPGGDRRKSFEFEGATFHLVPSPTKGRALLFFQNDPGYFKSLFGELRPDVVHGWGTEDSYGLVARRLAPRRHVIGIQGLIRAYYKYLPKTYRTLFVRVTERMTLKKARNIVAESHYSLDSAAPLCSSAIKSIIEHPLRSEFLTSPPSEGTDRTVLFVGAIEERKGVMDAIVAFSQTAPEDWKLHLVGKGTPKNESHMYRLLRDTQMESRFHHSRMLDAQNLVKAMRSSSVFLLPTRIDTGPTALKEALTMGLWPVCYDNSGPGEYVRKYAFGSLAKDQDMNSLCRELKHCLTDMPWKDLDKRNVLARRTREDFSRELAWDQLTEFYRRVASSSEIGNGIRRSALFGAYSSLKVNGR